MAAESDETEDGSENEGEKKETRIVLDMGSGAYDLGQKLVKLGPMKDQNILLTHCHWDHIQGFPFFAPLFIPGSHWSVHAPGGFTTSLKEKLSSQMSYDFFPLSIEMLAASIEYHDLTEGQLTLGGVQVTSQFLNHPVLTLGYRLEAPDGTTMAYITDHEPFNRAFAVDGYTRNHSVNPNDGSNTTPDNGDDRHVEFLKDVDLLLHDAQYTAEEYKGKVGWGHGTIEYVTDIAVAAEVKTLCIFHHDPQRTDDQVDELLKLAQNRAQQANSSLEIIAAADRKEIIMPPKETSEKRVHEATMDVSSGSAFTNPSERCGCQRVLVCYHNEHIFDGCKEDGADITFVKEDNGPEWEDILNTIDHRGKPNMYLIACAAKYQDKNGVDLCCKLRTEVCAEVPIFLIAAHSDMKKYKAQAQECGAHVTDWIPEPFTPAYIRTRVRMGISRCRWVPPEIPKNEEKRLETLHALNLSEEEENRFDNILKLAKTTFGVDAVGLNIIEKDFHWTKSLAAPMLSGTRPKPVNRDVSICSHVILQDDVMVVNDTLADYRFADNPLVNEGMKIRFYAGVPISVPSGEGGKSYNVGTLCAMHKRPRKMNEHEKDLIRQFAGLLEREMLLQVPKDVNSGPRMDVSSSSTEVDC